LIRLRILGSAAGGGLPQWNCPCPNCLAARAGQITPQTQSSIAVGAESGGWLLINASPDFARQIENMPDLQPHRTPPRNSPIASVFLTNADLDHALGLLLMRQEETHLVVYATEETQRALGWLETVLKPFRRIEWRMPSPTFQSLGNGIAYRAIALRKSIACQLRDEASGATALLAPAVGELTDELREAVNASDVVGFDGTFWSNEELGVVRDGARTARQMSHLPISDGSLDFLRAAPARRKFYTHINNTNPILMPSSNERRQVEEAGIEIAYDGLEITL
jgi:pyrroloquinoline quinone biosynthesis protein B